VAVNNKNEHMKKKIALVTGGYSGESVISYKSATTIQNNLDTDKWDVYLIDIKPNGWFYTANNGDEVSVDKNDFSITTNGSKINFDAVMIGLHGTPGEDGKLQGYFDCLNIPYTSCNAATSALTFNKRYTVAVAAFSGISVAKSVHLFKSDVLNVNDILAQVQLPVFVKPNNGGSSIGMSKVNLANDLEQAITKAFNEDEQVLIEEFIKGREFTIGVYKTNGIIKTLPMTEIITTNEFFDYQAKYEGKSTEVTPANATEQMASEISQAAKKIYSVFNCNGVVRIDFIYDETVNKPFMLEINTVPGQSAASIIPQQVAAIGGTLKEFYSSLLEECLA
jgi:D-alanine-D-alanine ligase